MTWRRCSSCGDWAECDRATCRQCDCAKLDRWRKAEARGLPVVPLFPELEPPPAAKAVRQETLEL